MKKSMTIFLILSLILTACSQVLGEQNVEEIPLVQLKEINENPQEYLNKRVWIEGEIEGAIERHEDPGSNQGTVYWLVFQQPAYIFLNRPPSCTSKFTFSDANYSIKVIEESSTCKISDPPPQGKITILGMVRENLHGDFFIRFIDFR